MKWIIEYNNGHSISENEINFQFVNKENIKLIYFSDNNNRYGLDFSSRQFFINNKFFNFKINNNEFDIVQFKNASISWNNTTEEKINSWNIGLKNKSESYVMSINYKREITLIASRNNKDVKVIQLQ